MKVLELIIESSRGNNNYYSTGENTDEEKMKTDQKRIAIFRDSWGVKQHDCHAV